MKLMILYSLKSHRDPIVALIKDLTPLLELCRHTHLFSLIAMNISNCYRNYKFSMIEQIVHS